MLTVAAGDDGDIGNITFSCPADSDDCMIAVMVADDGTVSATSTGGMATAADSNAYVLGNTRERLRLYRVTSEQRAAAVDAAKMAAMAVEDAVKYGAMFDPAALSAAPPVHYTASVKGDSSMATMNAQTVLDARDTTKQAVTDAEDAKKALEMAETAAMALPDDAERTSLLTAIDNAIAAAEEQIEMAEEQRDSADLRTALARVEYGADTAPTDDTVAREASYYGEQVATAIDTAIDPATALGTTNDLTDIPTSPTGLQAVNMTDNRMGMTFGDIVGKDNLMTIRIDRTADTADSGTMEVMAASFDGMMLSAINGDAGTASSDNSGGDRSSRW